MSHANGSVCVAMCSLHPCQPKRPAGERGAGEEEEEEEEEEDGSYRTRHMYENILRAHLGCECGSCAKKGHGRSQRRCARPGGCGGGGGRDVGDGRCDGGEEANSGGGARNSGDGRNTVGGCVAVAAIVCGGGGGGWESDGCSGCAKKKFHGKSSWAGGSVGIASDLCLPSLPSL